MRKRQAVCFFVDKEANSCWKRNLLKEWEENAVCGELREAYWSCAWNSWACAEQPFFYRIICSQYFSFLIFFSELFGLDISSLFTLTTQFFIWMILFNNLQKVRCAQKEARCKKNKQTCFSGNQEEVVIFHFPIDNLLKTFTWAKNQLLFNLLMKL